jgi:hypothetical protein
MVWPRHHGLDHHGADIATVGRAGASVEFPKIGRRKLATRGVLLTASRARASHVVEFWPIAIEAIAPWAFDCCRCRHPLFGDPDHEIALAGVIGLL